ncbi:cyclopropane-fatty-acyl-phospholipid synthase family protein [Streptomyces sp. VRA16 Mangrove soil]|uniref:SAM-dependent methyltransferase n=1 Tax=Streptomyces sp. VRA16 Mangrove soil TaxID=2817434 RepID=UPI0035AC18F8
MSEARVERMIGRLAGPSPVTVVDIGCGWGEMMLRMLDAVPGATARGIDINAEDLARGRADAEARGLAGRAEFVEMDAKKAADTPADVVLCLGSSQALIEEDTTEPVVDALRALRRMVNPGGRVLLGEGYFERPPTDEELAVMWPGASRDDHTDLATLVDLAVEAGFRPVWIETASQEEWEEFESGYQSDTEEWLANHPGHPLAEQTRERLDKHRTSWLRGYRNVLGIAYLTLVPVA